MPKGPSVYRSFVTCSDPEGVVDCGAFRKERRNMPKSLNMSCSSRGARDEGVGNVRNSSSQLEEIEKGAVKLNKMIDSWASGMSIDGESKDIAQDLLRGALDLQESLNMLSKLQEASLYMAKLKRLEKRDEKGRISVDGSARSKCVDEVKKVIQDSPVRQSLLPGSYMESRWDRKGISCASEGHSTSSVSSVSFSKKACSTDNSSVSSDTSDKNRKRPNLIAKLMGLEDRKPVQAITASTSNEVQNEKRVPAFDIDLPKSKKPHVSTQVGYQEKKTLRELLESSQSTASSESKFVERLIPVLDLVPRTTPENQSRAYADKFPPIVLMKPLHTPYKEFDKSHEQCFNASEIVKELKAKNWFSNVQEQVSGRASSIKSEKNSKCTTQIQILTPESRKLPQSAVAKLQSTKTQIKEKASVSMERTPRADRISKTVKSPDVTNSIKKSTKVKNVSGTKLSVSKETPVAPSKASNPDKNPSIVRTRASTPKLSENATSKFTKETAKHYSIDVKKTQKRKVKPLTQPLSGDTLRHDDDVAAMDISCQGAHVATLPVKTKTINEAVIEEHWRDVEVVLDTSVNEVSREKVTSNTSCLKSRSFQQNVLLSSPSFATFVEVLFHFDLTSNTSTEVKSLIHTDADTTLFISYAKEVIERRSKELLFSASFRAIPVSLNHLLEEVCEAYEAIESYKDGTPTVDIFDMLDRDMKCKEVVSSVWDLGWKNGGQATETEQIVANLEKLILRDFIDEIFVH